MQETLPSGLKLILAVQMICQAKLIHLMFSIDFSFIVSALALRCKGLYKNLQLVKVSASKQHKNSISTSPMHNVKMGHRL